MAVYRSRLPRISSLLVYTTTEVFIHARFSSFPLFLICSHFSAHFLPLSLSLCLFHGFRRNTYFLKTSEFHLLFRVKCSVRIDSAACSNSRNPDLHFAYICDPRNPSPVCTHADIDHDHHIRVLGPTPPKRKTCLSSRAI